MSAEFLKLFILPKIQRYQRKQRKEGNCRFILKTTTLNTETLSAAVKKSFTVSLK